MTDLEIISRIYEVFIKTRGRRTLKVICFRDLEFIDSNNYSSVIGKIKTEYWRFAAYYLGYCRKKENHRPNYEDILELNKRTEKYLKRVNNIRQRNWFWKKPVFIKNERF
jgi:hypothetical protein